MAKKGTREMIVEVAAGLFATEGLRGTTMETIAAAAGRGRRTVYMHFRNKAAVYEAVVVMEVREIIEPLRRILSGEAPLEQLLLTYGRERASRLNSLAIRNPLLIKDFALGHSRIERLRARLRKAEIQLLTPLFSQCEAVISNRYTAEELAITYLNMLMGNDLLLTKKDGLSEAIRLSSLAALLVTGASVSLA